MNYGRTMRLAAVGSLLALISHAVHADVLIDTGLPTSDLVSTLCTWRAGQITSTSSLAISGIENYVQVSQPIVARITLRADEGGLPGTVLYSANHSLSVAPEGFQGPLDLNWTVGPGSYWFTFEVPYDPVLLDCPMSAARRRLGFTTEDPRPELHGTAPPNALAREAYLAYGGTLWGTNSTRLGWRVTGTQGAVVVNGREWRQLTEVTGFTWSQVATVCNSGSGACSGSLGGVSFDGWTWASNQDVQALFEELIRPGTVEFPTPTSDYIVPDSPDVAAALGPGGFAPTAFSSTRVSGWTRTAFIPPQVYYSPSIVNDGNSADGSTIDIACLGCGGVDTDTGPYRGVWLYRDVYAGTLSLSLSTSTAPGCRTVTGIVTLSEPAPVGGALITLSDTLAQATMPATIAIPAGETTASFLITTTPVSGLRSGSVSATLAGQTVTQPLTLRPIGLASLRLDPLSVVGSQPVVGQAQLECPAGPGPITVNLESSNPTLANPVTPYLVIPQGVQSQQFGVTTNLVPTSTTVQIVGTANDTRRSRGLTLMPPVMASTTRLSFGKVPIGTYSVQLQVTITNQSAYAATWSGLRRISTVPGFPITATYPYLDTSCAVVPPGGNCVFFVSVISPAGEGKFLVTDGLTFSIGTVSQEIELSLRGTLVP